MKSKLLVVMFLLGLFGCNDDREMESVGKEWEEAFLNPPESTKPYVYWYWVNDNISKEGITRDLEAMAEVGIGEAFIGNVVSGGVEMGKVPVLSEEWWSCIEHAVYEAERLGIKVGMFNCPGWSQSGGPWVKPEQTMRYLVSEEKRVKGGQDLEYTCKPSGYDHFQLVSVQAFPAPAQDDDRISAKSPVVSSAGIPDAGLLFDGNAQTGAIIPASTTSIEIRLEQPATVRSLQLFPTEHPMGATCMLEVCESNGQWKQVAQTKIERQYLDITVGPMQFGPISVNFPAVTGQEFRITFSDSQGGKLSEIELCGAARLTSYVEKQLGKLCPTAEVRADSYNWPASAEPEDRSLVVDPARMIDLSDHVDANGTLKWDAPEGDWVVLCTGMVPTGVMNSPTTPEGSGLEIDKMNKEVAKYHFKSSLGELLKRIPAGKRPGLRHIVADSYEKGSQNWTDGFAKEFERVYGYDPSPWLPVLTGRIIESADRSERFLWDMRRLIADRIASEYVGGLRESCEENGLRLWLENYGHWGFPGEFLNYGGASHDIGGEFWYSAPTLGPVEVRCASSAGHIYGKNVISAEAFTSIWSFNQMPRNLKIRGDWSWCSGINHFVMHVYIHQPDARRPGMNAWFGTDFNRHNTWFSASKSYFDYIRRSCALLQSGYSVADVAYYIGEDVPKMTGDMDPALPKGHNYDFINAEVLKKDAHVVDGRIVLSSGASYAVLVLPPHATMRPEVLEKIAKLVKDGACIIGNAPMRSPSNQHYPESDKQVEALAHKIWGDIPGLSNERLYGKGRIFSGVSLEEALSKLGVKKDCVLPDGFLYTHRQEAGAHLYFVSNQQETSRKETIAFRVDGLQPELWNPVTGEIRTLPEYRTENGMTYVPLEFGPGDSWFIVFRQKGAASSVGVNFPVAQPEQSIEGTWAVEFKPSYGESFQSTFAPLSDWRLNEDQRIRYYSGTATYRLTFQYNGKADETTSLDLGQVEGLATVRLNGQEYPTMWCYPYRIHVSNALQTGENELEVEVVNCWWNRLVGDAQPGAKPVTWAAFVNWNKDSELLPSGLLGPVHILSTPTKKQ